MTEDAFTTVTDSKPDDRTRPVEARDETNPLAARVAIATDVDTRNERAVDSVKVVGTPKHGTSLISAESDPEAEAVPEDGDQRRVTTTNPRPVALAEPNSEPPAYEKKSKQQQPPPVARPDYRALLLDSKARHDATLRRGGDAHARKQHLLYAIDVFFLEHVWAKRDDWLRADECGMWLVTFGSGDDFWAQRFERQWCAPDPRLRWQPRRMWPQTPLPRGLEAVERVVGDTYRRMIVNAFIDRDEFGATPRTQFIVFLHLAFLDTHKSEVHVCDVSVPPESLWHRHMSGDLMTGFEPRMRALWAYEKRAYADARRAEAAKELADEKRRHEADRAVAAKRAAKRTAKKRAHRATAAGRRRDGDANDSTGGTGAIADRVDENKCAAASGGGGDGDDDILESKRTRVFGGDGDESDADAVPADKDAANSVGRKNLGVENSPTVFATECCGESKRTDSGSPTLPDR